MNACTVGRVPEKGKEACHSPKRDSPYDWKGCADFYFKKNSGLGARVDAMTAPASRAGCFPGERYPPGGAPGAGRGGAPHMFRHVPPQRQLHGRRPLNRDRPWPGRSFPPPFFVGRLVGRLFRRGIIQIYQLSAEDAFSFEACDRTGQDGG
jgi:hypothetical protein